jgi:hypothetical protein
MTIEYAANEFTVSEILDYLKAAFGYQINGSPFKSYHIYNWIRLRKLPDAYGGYKILDVISMKGLSKVIVLDGFNREMLDDVQMFSPPPITILPQIKRPRKQRTRLYYELLEKAGKQYTRKTKKLATISNQWKAAGIKPNQLVR